MSATARREVSGQHSFQEIVMMKHALLILAAGLLIAADPPDKEKVKKEMDQLQGTWTVASGEHNGEKVPEEQIKLIKLTIKDDKMTVKRGDETIFAGTVKVDPTTNPKQIDVTVTEGEGKGKTRQAIYALDGDTMKLCHGEDDQPRPKELASKKADNTALMVLKRAK
jgi:uncharacterized protein (TIGR03067 family)